LGDIGSVIAVVVDLQQPAASGGEGWYDGEARTVDDPIDEDVFVFCRGPTPVFVVRQESAGAGNRYDGLEKVCG
jgi:hypothetical protein